MKRPELNQIPLTSLTFGPGVVIITVSVGQWDAIHAAAYDRGHTLLELDANERPIRAYRKPAVAPGAALN
jgi:hypothetical protein